YCSPERRGGGAGRHPPPQNHHADSVLRCIMRQTVIGRAMARKVGEYLFEAHRGAFFLEQCDVLLVFGHDGRQTDSRGRARREVETVVAWARQKKLKVSFFGTDDHGYSWALGLCVRGLNPDEQEAIHEAVTDILWWAWMKMEAGEEDDGSGPAYEA